MLVLSRGPKEEILFPKLGITVKVVRISGNRVRLGVEAPKEIDVIRSELVEAQSQFNDATAAQPVKESDHRLRNRMHAARLSLELAAAQLERGLQATAFDTLSKSLREFDSIDNELSEAVPAGEPVDANIPRALLVEDDDNERELLAGYLSLSGFEVDTAGDGLGALVKLSRFKPPSVVLLDMNMPKMDGRETLDRIRGEESLRKMRVIAVSGMRPEEVGIEIGPAGVDYWFQKPVDPRALVAEMQRELACTS